MDNRILNYYEHNLSMTLFSKTLFLYKPIQFHYQSHNL